MNREQILTLAQRRIDIRKFNAEDDCYKTLQRLRDIAEWRACECNLKQAQVEYVMSDGEAKRKAKERADKYYAKQKELMRTLGVKEKDLTPQYNCLKCNDSGYVNGTMCSCLQNEIRNIVAEESDVGNRDYTFENSKETNKHNLAVYKKACKAVEDGQNVLLTGSTGSGKTYLLSACCNRAVQLCKSVLLITAYKLNSMFLEGHLSDYASKQAILDSLIDVDALAIDDLGTEITYKNVTAEYLFTVLNERINRKKSTYVSTNLSLEDIRDRYDERLFSRLLDQQLTFVAKLEGEDKRLKKH